MERKWPFAGLCIIVLCLVMTAGCGGGNSSGASAGAAIPDSPPRLELPSGLPPKRLVVKDLQKGTGKEAEKGDEVKIQYYGISWEDGDEVSNTWNYSAPPTFVLGKRQLIRGVTLAVIGMKEGGGREVIVPHRLIYYPGESHPPIRRLGAVIYKVYLVKVLRKGRGN